MSNEKVPEGRKRNDIPTTNNNRPHKFVRVELGDNVNHFVVERNPRFDENMIDLLILSASLDPKDSFKSFDIEKIALISRSRSRLTLFLHHFLYMNNKRSL